MRGFWLDLGSYVRETVWSSRRCTRIQSSVGYDKEYIFCLAEDTTENDQRCYNHNMKARTDTEEHKKREQHSKKYSTIQGAEQ